MMSARQYKRLFIAQLGKRRRHTDGMVRGPVDCVESYRKCMGVANLMLNGHTVTDVAAVVAEPGVGEIETTDVSYAF